MMPIDTNSTFSSLRLRMVDSQLRARGISDARVLDAMARVPRHEFVPETYRDQAYEDHPVVIGEGQTISQPYIVGLMLEVLALSPGDRVLEIGTGSGYLTTLLAELTAQVVSIERHASLADRARALLSKLGDANVRIITGDGTQGFAEAGPYNAIIVSAAASELPQALTDQLAEGGRMIVPVGGSESQQLQFIRKVEGKLIIQPRELCRFVPLVRDGL
ncbi:MAG TPA: protein-L-isoaspartate(D-aspartate) O-methyltransferase [Candidatus Sulfotelmatobacter sp.]|jgi:protein-L-isoaspartate(D-aspartate) O-methyltransferase|nr:protein-L-isoaspartate(D-aspartate) O-methyltransferase [Candidatus Sulfotelmatobacter sp.]